MTKLQEDLLNIYNTLVIFNKDTIVNPFPIPIKVRFDKESSFLIYCESFPTNLLLSWFE